MRVDFNEEDSSISGAIQLDFSCIKPTRDIFTSSLVSYKDYFYKEIYSREGRDRQHWKIQDLVSFWMLLYASPCLASPSQSSSTFITEKPPKDRTPPFPIKGLSCFHFLRQTTSSSHSRGRNPFLGIPCLFFCLSLQSTGSLL